MYRAISFGMHSDFDGAARIRAKSQGANMKRLLVVIGVEMGVATCDFSDDNLFTNKGGVL